MTDSQIPDKISYNDTDVDNLNKVPVVKKGWIKGLVIGHTKATAKETSNMMLYLTIAPTDEEGKQRTPTVRLRVMPPIPNPKVAGHSAPDTGFSCYCFARALNPEFPLYAKKQSDGTYRAQIPSADGTVELGKVVNKEERNAIAREVDQAICAAAVRWWNEPAELNKEMFFAYVDHNIGTDGNTYAEVKKTMFREPQDADVMYSDFAA
jgi:hypothetical protein